MGSQGWGCQTVKVTRIRPGFPSHRHISRDSQDSKGPWLINNINIAEKRAIIIQTDFLCVHIIFASLIAFDRILETPTKVGIIPISQMRKRIWIGTEIHPGSTWLVHLDLELESRSPDSIASNSNQTNQLQIMIYLPSETP